MFKKFKEDGILPQSQTANSAGYDVYANEDVTIGAGETKIVPLGICLNEASCSLKGFFWGLYLRSSYGAKGLILPNGVGIIDMDYQDEIKQIIHNPYTGKEKEPFVIKKGDRVGQLIIQKHEGFKLLRNNYRKIDTKRDGGIGSTSR